MSGWDLLTNSGQINSADIKGLNWDVMENYIGVAESISLDGISIDNRTLIINQSEILGFSSTTGGNSPEIVNIEKFKTGFSYNNSLTFDIDTLIGDSLNASGVLKISLENEFDADLNVSIYPEFYTDELGYDIGQIQGQIQYRDSTLFFQNLKSSEGHFIEKGQVKIDLSEWEILGKTILGGRSIEVESIGTTNSALGTANISGFGSLGFKVLLNDSTYLADISSNNIRYNNISLWNVKSELSGDLDFEYCELKMNSNEINLNTEFNPKNILWGSIESSGTAQIASSDLIRKLTGQKIEFGSQNLVKWDMSKESSKVFISTDQLNYNRLRFNEIEFEGDLINLSGHLSCNDIFVINDNRSEMLVSSLNSQISNDDILKINSTWKSVKGVDGELEISGRFDNEIDLTFSMVTEPITKDQTTGWFGIALETNAIEIDGKISGTIKDPEISLNTHSTDINLVGENISDSYVNIEYNGKNNIVSAKFIGFGELDVGEITLQGYFSKEEIDLRTSISDFALSKLNPYLEKSTVILDGIFSGDFKVEGLIDNPQITGDGQFSNSSIKIDYLGTNYNLEGTFHVEPDAIELNGLSVNDGKGGQGLLVGTVLHNHFNDWNIDISLSADENELEILNLPYSPERYFYGTGKCLGDFNVFGYEENIVIEANIKTSEATDFVLPLDVVSSSDWSSFVNIKEHNPSNSTLNKVSADRKTNVSLDINIEVDPISQTRIVFNSELGDKIIGRCKGHLHMDLHDLERLDLVGELEIVEGEYSFNLKNIISKKFQAIPGGTIRWFGDPYNAHIDISTNYKTRASLRPILPEITDATKYNIDLGLNLQGELLRPDILFNIGVPEASAQNKASLTSLFSNEEELNRQAVSLLVINSFLPGTWHASAVGSTGIQESSSELITAQIGHWLSGISDDVNVGIDYDSPLSTGDEASIAIALSTQIFNDRLHIEGEVGTQNIYSGTTDDFQIQDVKIKYDINEDGSVQLTGYSTQKATVPGLEGENVQGVGILFNKDFESIKGLFKRKSKK